MSGVTNAAKRRVWSGAAGWRSRWTIPLVMTLVVPAVADAAVVNGSFDDGLDGWTADVARAEVPGTVEGVAGRAVLTENGSFVTNLEQGFLVPRGLVELSFEVEALAGFEVEEGGIPDAFEARLVDASGASLVAMCSPDGTGFFNLGEDGTALAADGVTVDGTRVTLDMTGVPEGASVRLVFSLVGADAGAT